MDNKKNYLESLKATSLFGGVQIYSIILTLISAKFVAVLLGPEGSGISGLLSSTIGFITSATALGLGTSAVKDISSAYASGDKERFSLITNVFRRLVWITGLLGMSVCLFFSPLWSKLNFDNSDYILSFAILSITILFGQISSGQGVVLQGTRQFKYMAKSRMLGQTIGLCFSTPLFYFLGLKGIVPAMLISSIVGLCLTHYYSRKIKVDKLHLQTRTIFKEGKQMLSVGFLIAMQGFASLLVAYLIRIYISHEGGIADVGLYNSGFSMVDMSVGLVLTAIGTEYYPRLSSLANNIEGFTNAINQQIHLALLLLTPIIVLFLLFSHYAIIILLSEKYLSITTMVQILILGTFFKIPGWCYGFAFLAKADSKAFWMNEASFEILRLLSFILLYKYLGLNGIAIAFFLFYVCYTFVTGLICKKRYNYMLNYALLRNHLPQFLLIMIIFLSVSLIGGWLGIIISVPFCILSLFLCYTQLNKIINIKDAVCAIRNKILNKK